jgi:hypothetical protein
VRVRLLKAEEEHDGSYPAFLDALEEKTRGERKIVIEIPPDKSDFWTMWNFWPLAKSRQRDVLAHLLYPYRSHRAIFGVSAATHNIDKP